jgi:hypothetical protein
MLRREAIRADSVNLCVVLLGVSEIVVVLPVGEAVWLPCGDHQRGGNLSTQGHLPRRRHEPNSTSLQWICDGGNLLFSMSTYKDLIV